MKIRFRTMQVVASLFTLLLAVTTVNAQGDSSPVLQRIAKTKILRVGMTGEQPPFNVKNRDGKLIGVDVDLGQALARSMGVTLEIVEMPFAKLLPALEDGKVDIVMSGMTITLQRNVRVPFVGPYHVSGKSMLAKSDTLAAMQSAKELNTDKWKIAVLRGSTSEEFVKSRLGKTKLTTTVNYDEAIDLLLEGKVDAVVADAPVCALTIMRYPDAGLVRLHKPLTIEPIGIAIAPGDALLVNLVGNYLQALRASGILEQLQKKWFEDGAWLVQLP